MRRSSLCYQSNDEGDDAMIGLATVQTISGMQGPSVPVVKLHSALMPSGRFSPWLKMLLFACVLLSSFAAADGGEPLSDLAFGPAMPASLPLR